MLERSDSPKKLCEKCKKNPCQCKKFGPGNAEKKAEDWRKKERSRY